MTIESTRATAAPEQADTPELRRLLVEYAVSVNSNKSLTEMDAARHAVFRYVSNLQGAQTSPSTRGEPATDRAGREPSEAVLTGALATFVETMPPGGLTQIGFDHVMRSLRAATKFYLSQSAAREPAPVARDLSDLLTYPSPHGKLVRLADVQCRVFERERGVARELDVEAERRAFREVVRKLYEPHMGPDWEIMLDRPRGGDFAFRVWLKARQATAESAPASAAPADAVIAAARKLVTAKGRYHTEQNYKALKAEVQAHDALAAALTKLDNSPVGAKESK